ncbi:biopolymer transporter ExbD [Pelomonas sp. KK5]|uniref:ExbD/TolR family protein n=1 Tax=Pelomonas sp. KK5 TaxID=1855730 RepID=UPI00097C8F8F|nr:biopolymer transporter ExbD [Pelomonas sp. KK5]
MAMSIGPGAGPGSTEVMSEINTTPLIDVMLVLLIMLIITIPVQLHAVNLNLPQGTPPPPPKPPEVVRIDVDAAGRITWNGEPLPADQVEPRLKAQVAELPEQPEVHLHPDKRAGYDTVAAVLAAAQRVGVTRLGVTGHEQFID